MGSLEEIKRNSSFRANVMSFIYVRRRSRLYDEEERKRDINRATIDPFGQESPDGRKEQRSGQPPSLHPSLSSQRGHNTVFWFNNESSRIHPLMDLGRYGGRKRRSRGQTTRDVRFCHVHFAYLSIFSPLLLARKGKDEPKRDHL